jgi:FKBP-type peptidyl-prolyl cis-trans isomerase
MKHLFLFLPLVFLISCKDDSAHPGFTEAEPGVFYKLHVPGESGKKAGQDDFYEVKMQNKYAGKVFFDSEFQNSRGTLLVLSSASRYFSVLSEGDSATFLLPGGDLNLPGMPDTGMVEMNVKIVSILTADEVQKREADQDPDTEEEMLIEHYIGRNKMDVKPDSLGVFYSLMTEGSGKKPVTGDTVRIHYRGSLMSGQIIDDSHRLKEPFMFIFGQEGQILPGLQAALWHMKAGGKAKIILPSRLAFGTEGSSTGIVPPHTPVVYELELVSVE